MRKQTTIVVIGSLMVKEYKEYIDVQQFTGINTLHAVGRLGRRQINGIFFFFFFFPKISFDISCKLSQQEMSKPIFSGKNIFKKSSAEILPSMLCITVCACVRVCVCVLKGCYTEINYVTG